MSYLSSDKLQSAPGCAIGGKMCKIHLPVRFVPFQQSITYIHCCLSYVSGAESDKCMQDIPAHSCALTFKTLTPMPQCTHSQLICVSYPVLFLSHGWIQSHTRFNIKFTRHKYLTRFKSSAAMIAALLLPPPTPLPLCEMHHSVPVLLLGLMPLSPLAGCRGWGTVLPPLEIEEELLSDWQP